MDGQLASIPLIGIFHLVAIFPFFLDERLIFGKLASLPLLGFHPATIIPFFRDE
jgi:hypothetical protein